MTRRVAVIGAGAAGLTAALRAAEAGARVVLPNAHPRVGLKILMSGGTRCNVTHREVSERDFNTDSGSLKVVRNLLRAFPPDRTREWFESLGVELKLEETGKYFPLTDDAQTVLDALLRAVGRAGVELRGGARAVRLLVARQGAGEPGPRFRIGVQEVRESAALGSAVAGRAVLDWSLPDVAIAQWLEADAVVLATGGLSFPRTGSDGTGYALAQSLGHTIVPPVPALTPLAAEDPLCSRAQGIALEVELTLWVDGRRAIVARGALLFAHFGYTGPAALDLSRHWLRAAGADRRRVTVSFAPDASAEALAGAWIEAARRNPAVNVRRWLGERVPDRLAIELCVEAGVDPSRALGQIDRGARARLVGLVVERELPVTGTLGYEKAEVTAGGVRLDEVDGRTLESRIVPGLFLCGEALDVEGRLGGFNFQWAWSSGTVAGRSAAR